MFKPADSIHVLQVDDTPLLDETIEFPDSQETDSLTVTTTARASSALELLEANAIDGIVTADQLPDTAGLAFADAVREAGNDIPILLLTESDSVASDAVSQGVTDVFRKETHAGHADLLANRIRLLVERHRSVEKVTRTRQRHTELAEQSNELLWVFDGDWSEIRFVNSAYEAFYGRSVEQLRANPAEFLTAIHPADQDRVTEAMQRISGGESVELEFRITRPDGEQRWIRAEAQPVVEDGTVTRIVGASRDITERKRRESRHNAHPDGPDEMLDSVPDLFYALDADRNLARWNDTVTAVTGYSGDEIASIAPAELFAPSDRETVRRGIEAVFETGEASFEAELLTADGTAIPYEFTGGRIEADDGTVRGVVGIGRDISDREDRNQDLERQNERLEEFASVVSHDLRNPLDVARGRLELAQIEHDSDHLDAVERAHQRIGQLIEDLLTLAQNGESALDSKPVPLQTVVEQCWQTVETGDATLALETDAVVRADPSRFRQLFENLIRNSVEHGSTTDPSQTSESGSTSDRIQSDEAVEHGSTTPHAETSDHAGEQSATRPLSQSLERATGDLTITVGELADGFYVADNGVGIPADERDNVFERGYSLAAGPGFGLRIVKEIASTHGWSITVTESDDGGARFEVTDVEFDSA